MKKCILKKGILSVCTILLLAGGSKGLAATINDADINVENNTVSISGNIGLSEKDIVLIVLNPGAELENIGDNPLYLQHQKVISSDDNGDFFYTFKLNLDGENDSGTYKFYIGGKNVGEPVYNEFYFASESEVNEIITKLLEAESQKEIYDIIKDEENAKKLSVSTFKPFSEQDKSEISKLLFNILKSLEQETYSKADMQKIIYECAVVSAFNNGKDELVTDENDDFLYEDVLKISELDKEFNMTLIEIYNDTVSNEGRELIRESLFNKSYNNIDELRKDFAKQILLKGLTNVEKSGFSHVKKILTDENAKVVGLEITKTLTDNNAIAIASEKEYTSIKALQDKIDSLKNTVTATGGKNNTGSTGGTFGSISVDKTGYVTTETEKAEVKEDTGKNKRFTDLEEYSWAEEAIYSLQEKGIVNGVSDSEFAPKGNLTREQAVKILCLAAGIEGIKALGGFLDVDSNAWYAEYIMAAKEAGVVKGISDTEFGIGEKITRQDFAVMILRAFELSAEQGDVQFTDYDTVSDYAKEAVKTLSKKGIINGYADGTFKPFANCTRAEAAVIIYRILGGNA